MANLSAPCFPALSDCSRAPSFTLYCTTLAAELTNRLLPSLDRAMSVGTGVSFKAPRTLSTTPVTRFHTIIVPSEHPMASMSSAASPLPPLLFRLALLLLPLLLLLPAPPPLVLAPLHPKHEYE